MSEVEATEGDTWQYNLGYEDGCAATHKIYVTPIEGMKATIERLRESNVIICELAQIDPQLVIEMVKERRRASTD